jgi:hypothetical protein
MPPAPDEHPENPVNPVNPVKNRAQGTISTSQDVIAAAPQPLHATGRADLHPAIRRLHGILELEDPRSKKEFAGQIAFML